MKQLAKEYPVLFGSLLSVFGGFWGAIYIVAFKSASHASYPAIVLVMLITACVFSTLFAMLKGVGLRCNRSEFVLSIILAICTVVGNIATAAALRYSDPAVISVVLQVQIFFIALLELFILGSKIRLPLLLGAVVAIIGFLVMRFESLTSLQGFGGVGELWALLAAACYSLMLVSTRYAIERVNVVYVNAFRIVLSCLLMLLWPNVLTEVSALAWMDVMCAAVAGICGLVISRLCLMSAVRYISATQTKLITLVSPLFAFFAAWLVLHTTPSIFETIGSLIILLGVAIPLYMVLREEREQKNC